MIIALGEILIDYTQKGLSEKGMLLFEQNAGGAPANVLAALSKFGLDTAFIGKVGDDMQGHFLKKTLDDANINTQNLIIDKNYFTTLAFVSLSESGERSFAFSRKFSADINLNTDELDHDLIKQSKIFHFGSLSLTHNSSNEATYTAIKLAKSAGAIISYDPNYRAGLWDSVELAKSKMKEPLKYVDIIKISDEECELLTGESDVNKACLKLLDEGISIVIVTLGADGAIIGFNNEIIKITGCQSEKVVDTTGAGDSFVGGFLYSLYTSQKSIPSLTIEDLKMFARFANATASLCIEEFGAIKAMPTLEKVRSRL
ncbi:MAG: sugar kinase [Epulopiscium sp. Nele67-Bin005]|nr:MAG: sugar kinase [Epulopiscium sp. Nele67-Bin005]